MPKPFDDSRLRLYDRLSGMGRYAGVPKGNILWTAILDETGGRGIRPFRHPIRGWLELEEFRQHVPRLLRNYSDGVPPDVVAASLGMENSQALYDALDGQWVPREHDGDEERNLNADRHCRSLDNLL